MKIIVLGHSNSILGDGWLNHLKPMLPGHEFVNISIGGSPSPALLYQAAAYRERFADADLVIIEPTVVDHGEDWQTGAGVAGQAEALASWLQRNTPAHVLLLVLPRTPEWFLSPSQGMQAWAAVARRHGMSLVDGRQALQRHCAAAGIELPAAWRDNMGHTVSEAQKEVARDVATWIEGFATSPVRRTQSQAAGEGFRVIGGAALSARQGRDACRYRSSLMTVDCLRVVSGDRVTVDTAPNERVHGMAVNFGSFDPVTSVSMRAFSADGRSTPFKVGNPFLGAGPAGKLILMFAPTRIDHDVAAIEIDTADLQRFATGAPEALEIAGILVGPVIAAPSDWNQGSPALAAIHR